MEHDTELLWRELHERLHAFIARRVANPADADDLLQEVFLRIHQHLPTVRESERLLPWIFQVTRNVITDFYRAAPQRREVPENTVTEKDVDPRAGEGIPAHIEDVPHARDEELAPCLTPLIARLPDPYREAIQLVEINGLPQRVLSERLAVSLSGAKSRVQRGREKLKELLLHCCQVELDKRRQVMDYHLAIPGATCGAADVASTAKAGTSTAQTCRCLQQKDDHHERSTV